MQSSQFNKKASGVISWNLALFNKKASGVINLGFSLLEVIVGLTLMATLLVGSLLAFAAHQRQRRFADAKLQAVAIADELLDRFSNSPGGVPPSARGAIAGKPGWFWQTSPIGEMAPAQIPVRVIRFQVFGQPSNRPLTALVSVEMVQTLGGG
jgi:type II secretory pathway pseudopilin PulG